MSEQIEKTTAEIPENVVIRTKDLRFRYPEVDADAIAEYSVLRNQFRSMLGGARRSAMFEDWMAGNLAGSGFAPEAPAEQSDDAGDYDEE